MMIKDSMPPSRNINLDFARSVAIILVLLSHYSLLFSYPGISLTPVLYGAGTFGVELFFVLSGLLIGRILIRSYLVNPTWENLNQFWRRRWLRTLPAYYLVWVILFIISDHSFSYFLHLVMLQNYFPLPRDSFFGVSWSLASEEWFYFMAPLAMFFLYKLRSFKASTFLITFCIVGILICTGLRVVTALWLNQAWGDIRKSNIIRLDAFMFGMLISAVQSYYPQIYNSILRRKYSLALLSLCGILYCAIQFSDVSQLETCFNKTLLFSLIDLSFVPLLMLCEEGAYFNKWQSTWKQACIYFVSVTSYSVYLLHWDVMQYFRNGHIAVINLDGSLIKSAIMMLACVILTYILSYILYRYWEQPFMRYRDRNFIFNHDTLVPVSAK